ncbi:MAG: membrane protein insertion efficiency factor YidD [Rhodospirillales bacterium]|nr:membrane protein insertion efficiency factor YidD [Rhodospirillales bacterium]
MNAVLKQPSLALVYALVGVVHLYRYVISSIMPAHCRFTPTCSTYAVDAIQTHGAVHGLWLALKRVCRCHPWGACGHDPVPQNRQS